MKLYCKTFAIIALAYAFILLVLVLCVSVVGAAEVEERVIDLPADQGKWYISVVGERNAEYRKLVVWFGTNKSLVSLRNQTHFRCITTDTAIFKDRYASNTKGLPMVRVQGPKGVVVYEAYGAGLPVTAKGLYTQIAVAAKRVKNANQVLPWRRLMERKQRQSPTPSPPTVPPADPPPLDYEAQPIDFEDAPEFEGVDDSPSTALVVILAIIGALAGGITGVVVQWKRTYAEV